MFASKERLDFPQLVALSLTKVRFSQERQNLADIDADVDVAGVLVVAVHLVVGAKLKQVMFQTLSENPDS